MREVHFSSRAQNHIRRSGQVRSSNDLNQSRLAVTITIPNARTIAGTGTLIFVNAVGALLNSVSFLLSISNYQPPFTEFTIARRIATTRMTMISTMAEISVARPGSGWRGPGRRGRIVPSNGSLKTPIRPGRWFYGDNE